MGRLTTIISHAGFLKLEHVCVQYVTNTTSGSRSYLPQAPTQSHAKAANASVMNSDTSFGLDTITQ